MTRDDAVDAITEYKNTIHILFALVAIESLRFGLVAQDIEPALGLDNGAFFHALVEVDLVSAISAYEAVLENAAKGQLAPVATDDEWSEVINDG